VQEIFLIIPVDYAAGGLQRSAMAVRNWFDAAGFKVTIYCFKTIPEGLAEKHAFIQAITRERAWKPLFWAKTIIAMRGNIRRRRPRAVIAFGTAGSILLPLMAGKRPAALTIGSERAYPPAEPPPPSLAFLRRVAYPRLDFVVCQTAQIRDWFRDHLRLDERQLVVIPNIVAAVPQPSPARREDATANVLCVGRLDQQKGFALALRVFAAVRERIPEARLTIVGEGPLRQELEDRAAELGLADCVRFAGRSDNLAPFWSSADLFLFTSLYEGFPNALAEAMANGLACVAFDCPTGPSELIRNGVNGFLVPIGDVEQAAARCVELLENPTKRRSLGERARKVAQSFSESHVGKLWSQLIGQRPPRAGRRRDLGTTY
jgi:glycosyltransferase involved in cell wall biosynthesis